MSPHPVRFARRLHLGRPAVLHLGRGVDWWRVPRPVVSDGHRVWWCRAAEVVPLPWPDPVQLVGRRRELHGWLGDASRHVVADKDGWREHAWREPVAGPGRLWQAEGFLYRSSRGRVRAVDVGRARWLAGPHGALVGGTAEVAVVGSPARRTPRPLPAPLWWDSVRFDASGRRVGGVTEHGTPVRVDLRTMEVDDADAPAPDGPPGGATGGEFSPARYGPWLAGPGGVVWSLTSGRPAFSTPRLALGVTVGTPRGFVTVDWSSHEAWCVSLDGAIGWRVRLPLDPDDTVVSGVWDDGAVRLRTALGEGLRLVGPDVTPAEPAPPPPATAELGLGALGSMAVAGSAVVGGHRFGWTDDGWLLAMPLG